jgi:hypothetical protein
MSDDDDVVEVEVPEQASSNNNKRSPVWAFFSIPADQQHNNNKN